MAGADRDIYISKIDSQYLNKILTGRHSRQLHKMILKSGYPEDILSEVEKRLPSKIYSVNERDIRIQPVEDGQVVSVGQYQLQFIFVPGHSLGNAMLWDKKHGIMFTGDHILFDITPNITVFADMQDSLGAYLDSLERSKKYPVTMALPGHRMSGDYYKRIGELIQHHKNRLEEMLTVLEQHPNSNAYEIASNMSWHIHGNGWEDFPDRQKWYAVGETLAHLEYLVKRNMAFRYGKSGVYYYQAEPVARRVLAEIFLKKNK